MISTILVGYLVILTLYLIWHHFFSGSGRDHFVLPACTSDCYVSCRSAYSERSNFDAGGPHGCAAAPWPAASTEAAAIAAANGD